LNKEKTMTYGIRNPGPGLGQAQKGSCVKLVNGPPLITDN